MPPFTTRKSSSNSNPILAHLMHLISFSPTTQPNSKAVDKIYNYVLNQLEPWISSNQLFTHAFTSNGFKNLLISTEPINEVKAESSPVNREKTNSSVHKISNLNTPNFKYSGHKLHITLQSHVDVVPGPRDVFKPKIKEGFLYGRGASDMLFAVAVYIEALKRLFKLQNAGEISKKIRLDVLLTSDEEIGGFNGVKYFVDNGYNPDIVFLPDGGDNWNFVLQEKGVLHIKLEAFGKSAHGAYPWKGENANILLFKAYEQIENVIENLAKSVPEEVKQVAKLAKVEHWHPTINLGRVQGGEATNKIPDYACAKIDIRFTPENSVQSIFNKIKESLKNFEQTIKLTKLVDGEPMFIDKNNKFLNKIEEVLNKAGIKYGYTLDHGASDARFFSAKGIPVIMIKPEAYDHHADNERVSVKDLELFTKALIGWIKELGN